MEKKKPKYRFVITAAICFFLIVNTQYYWEDYLGFIDMFVLLGLVIAFLCFCVSWIYHAAMAIAEKGRNKNRIIVIGLLPVVLISAYFFPSGLTGYDRVGEQTNFEAGRKGVASCHQYLKLTPGHKYRYLQICFGKSEKSGSYYTTKDTIHFQSNIGERGIDYEFGVIKDKELFLYETKKDTTWRDLLIISKNNL